MKQTNKLKILNDPIYGFITIPSELIFDLIEHPYFQRLRRISQLGLTYLVYPGAYHTRFHHALGAMFLMGRAVNILKSKGHEITREEEEAVQIAILLHDIGHGPFSHALEYSIVPGVVHEKLSLEFMKILNEQFDGKLSLAIEIFTNKYHKQFLHQLISSQLDMDRLDYLRRDSFYTGVTEGQVNTERLISMLNVADDHIVVDSKGIYSVEKFLVSRRLMYWQVYLHKTVLSAEFLLIQILKRAKDIYSSDLALPAVLKPFVAGTFNKEYKDLIPQYALLDDYDVMAAIKEWTFSSDRVLRSLSEMLINRKLLGVKVSEEIISEKALSLKRKEIQDRFGFTEEEVKYFVFTEPMSNNAYNSNHDGINLLYKNGDLIDIAQASDQLNITALSKPVVKHFLFYPKP
ncbi:HD superfamily phosphohydrolase [Owenweeksia hongkongensis DSM 17368]|uniref:HD superfamily phosphohydrolase n=1 Tax=Owenweeksia hongkongensis (strain DSM 17368 / CIP 108786 / JCM 12287 / NRRL B-23963 / UST20020801) TaxID=926562 RepID=G8R1N9_OWEHD|nr:HD domain-containing protein [Owenweeksia hongkongensis]AEV32815.1 HD superfamily phosphohydrolase [Owenweeksia hongkongensis DSM 17368]